jgi:hypothetical protein
VPPTGEKTIGHNSGFAIVEEQHGYAEEHGLQPAHLTFPAASIGLCGHSSGRLLSSKASHAAARRATAVTAAARTLIFHEKMPQRAGHQPSASCIGQRCKTPAQRQLVTCGGPLRRNTEDSALGMPSFVLDFVMGCRCQGVDNSLQPGGVMLFGHPPLG